MSFGNNWRGPPAVGKWKPAWRAGVLRQEQEAADFLRFILADGPRTPKDVIEVAREARVSPWKIGYAQSKMGVAIAYKDERGRRLWRLP